MTFSNLERMLQLVDEFSATKNDPAQLSVNGAVMAKLRAMHPATLTARADETGPSSGCFCPTTHEPMRRFLSKDVRNSNYFDHDPTTLNT